ncbi:hypothetical protein OS493_035276 [Desmophyllum pertusum]|uniref:Uncharacterized protein n=1 Tax=Desmophyllum pertusum TaxID=174260 RepID=A0A9X0CNK7_9CNID|nr:hypothetical protein OS493_035276 [Desmophyllum pertusum]
MRIQILPRSTGSNKDFYKFCVAFFVIIYVFLWLSRPGVDNGLIVKLENYEEPFEPKSMVLLNNTTENNTTELHGKDFPDSKAPEFTKHWCRQRRERLDWKAMLSPCVNKIGWNSSRDKANATDPNTSIISLWDIRPLAFYTANITLDFHFMQWLQGSSSGLVFIIGNAQGKYQRHLEVDGNRDYLQAPLWDGSPVEITVPPASDDEYLRGISNTDCDVKCSFMWDGYGRWVQNKWKPYFKDPHQKHEARTQKRNIMGLWRLCHVFFAHSLMQRKLCRDIFKRCNFSYNWIYPVNKFTAAKRDNDNFDYDNERVLQSFRRIVHDPQMDEKSAIIVNFGLHFVESTNFTNYKRLIDGLVRVLTDEEKDLISNVTRRKFRGTVIWKTTTAINKEKASNINLGHKRFMTQQRILLYNAYATAQMCRAGFYVLDVFPITDSYPQGTGTHGAHGPVKNDIVHYSNLAFRPAEELLEEYFDGK